MPTSDHEFQLGLLPDKPSNWRTFAASYGMVTAFVLLLIVIGIVTTDTLEVLPNFRVTELIPLPSRRHVSKPKPLPVHAKLLPPDPVFKAPKLMVPREAMAPKPQRQEEVEAPKVSMNNLAPAVLKPSAGGARPVLIHTGEFQGSSVLPTVNAPIQKVQTGGFGDPNGLKPSENSKPNGKLIATAAGSFDMPVGPGQGNGSGGAKGIKGTVASANFGDGIATPGRGDGRSSGRGNAGVQSSGFGTQEIAQNVPHATRMETVSATSAVEITFKPNPVYTQEARNLKLEGEVLLEVEFSANGQLHVNRVVRGLGHGLDEAAMAAANNIRFKPATRSGQAVDSTAIVHVVFQLAY
ncbi:MAG: energy transducer TonB [Terriglobales bacterium]